MTETTKLRDGADVPTVVIATTRIALEMLQASNPIAFYELVTAARDPQHAMFGNTAGAAKALGMVEEVYGDGRVRIHEITRAIIRNTVTGEDLAMTLQNPVG